MSLCFCVISDCAQLAPPNPLDPTTKRAVDSSGLCPPGRESSVDIEELTRGRQKS